ncbi:MAG: branched-chain amino acid ABC transporter permease [Candidatus Caldarchaeum sp.]
MLSAELLIQSVMFGFLQGGLYALASLGLMITWGVLRLVNVAHGEFLMVGAYASYWALTLMKGVAITTQVAAALLTSALLGLGLALLLYFSVIKQLAKVEVLASLLGLFGLSLIMINIIILIWTVDVRGVVLDFGYVTIGPVTLIGSRLVAFMIAIVLVGFLFLFLYKSYWGSALRAVMQNRRAAALVGINMDAIYMLGFTIGIVLASIAGGLVSWSIAHVEPFMGGAYTLKSFAIVLIGGVTNPVGILISAITFAAIESVFAVLTDPVYSMALALAVIVSAIVVRGEKLFG